MKFLQLKEALEKCFPISKPRSPEKNVENGNVPSPPFYALPSPTQVRLKDGICRDPVDRNARMAICKPPWWAYLIYGTSSTRNQVDCIENTDRPKINNKCEKVHSYSRFGKSNKSKKGKMQTTTKKNSDTQSSLPDETPKPVTIPKQDRAQVLDAITRCVMNGTMTAKQAENTLQRLSL